MMLNSCLPSNWHSFHCYKPIMLRKSIQKLIKNSIKMNYNNINNYKKFKTMSQLICAAIGKTAKFSHHILAPVTFDSCALASSKLQTVF